MDLPTEKPFNIVVVFSFKQNSIVRFLPLDETLTFAHYSTPKDFAL